MQLQTVFADIRSSHPTTVWVPTISYMQPVCHHSLVSWQISKKQSKNLSTTILHAKRHMPKRKSVKREKYRDMIASADSQFNRQIKFAVKRRFGCGYHLINPCRFNNIMWIINRHFAWD